MLIDGIDTIIREATLFAGIWFLIGGIDDLLVDLIYLARQPSSGRRPLWKSASIGSVSSGHIAVFVPAWDESAVIGRMLRAALARFDYADYRLYAGAYPNDPATIAAIIEVAEQDSRVRLVVCGTPGPTTKADCLNAMWRAMLRDEDAEGHTIRAVVLHDAEDIVHPLELRVFAMWLDRCDAVQLPVMPLRFPGSPLVSGHYLDEFSEAHAKVLLVRQALGAGLPLAGVGCAIRREMLARIAADRGGSPFDATSLTEDYELGLTIATMGGRVRLARVPEASGGQPVAVRAYFPATLKAAVRQKARWMTGIALAGWDRTGWGKPLAIGDHWMRMRDRRATLAIPVLGIAYCTLVLWGLSLAAHGIARTPVPALSQAINALLLANCALVLWRTLVRAGFVWRAYGATEALWSIPRIFVGNFIALLAARRAATLYIGMLLGAAPRWDKTAHHFPDDPELLRP